MRRLARQLAPSTVDVAFEMGLDSGEVDKLRAAGSDVDACFSLLERWRDNGASGQALIDLLQDANLTEEAAAARNILAGGKFRHCFHAVLPLFLAVLFSISVQNVSLFSSFDKIREKTRS